jgi:hypothetical protein
VKSGLLCPTLTLSGVGGDANQWSVERWAAPIAAIMWHERLVDGTGGFDYHVGNEVRLG